MLKAQEVKCERVGTETFYFPFTSLEIQPSTARKVNPKISKRSGCCGAHHTYVAQPKGGVQDYPRRQAQVMPSATLGSYGSAP